MNFHHKTIGNVSVTWDDKIDEEMRGLLGGIDCYTADWILPKSPPKGSPKAGFCIRSQSGWHPEKISINFDNIPYFYRHDVNPEAMLWKDQLPLVVEALKRSEVNMLDAPNDALLKDHDKPRDVCVTSDQLGPFISNFNAFLG